MIRKKANAQQTILEGIEIRELNLVTNENEAGEVHKLFKWIS